MRLSEIRGERVFDVIADIIEPCCNIAQDNEVSALFVRKEEQTEEMTKTEHMADKVRRLVPVLIRTHRRDIAAIMAAIKGVTADEYMRDVSLSDLIGDVYLLLTDDDLLGFLSQREQAEEQPE